MSEAEAIIAEQLLHIREEAEANARARRLPQARPAGRNADEQKLWHRRVCGARSAGARTIGVAALPLYAEKPTATPAAPAPCSPTRTAECMDQYLDCFAEVDYSRPEVSDVTVNES